MTSEKDEGLADGIDVEGIEKTVQAYFDGLYNSDVATLERIFHPTCMVTGYDSKGQLQAMTRDTFLAFVASVPSPKAAGAPYDMETLGIDATPTTASVAVHDAYIGRDFIDYLHMVKTDDGWVIVAKTFHSEPLDAASAKAPA